MKRCRLPALFLVLGLFLLHGPMLRDHVGRVHGNLVDGRLVALLLEHAHQWLMGRAPSLLSPTWLFYPYPKALTLTDTLLGGTVLYSPLRWLGLSPLHAFQAWMVLSAALGFLAMEKLGRRLKLNSLGASLAAFVVTFGMPRVSAAHHPQLAFFLPVPLALLALVTAIEAPSPARKMVAALAAVLALVWQFWTAPYFAVFLLLGLAVAAVASLALGSSRRSLLTAIAGRPGFYLALAGATTGLFAIAMLPLVRATLAHGDLLQRPWQEVAAYLPTPAAFVFPHGGSLLYGWAHGPLVPFITSTSENQLFAGIVVLLAPFALAWVLWRRPSAIATRPLALVLLVVWGVLTLAMVGDRSGHSLWRLVHTLPGGSSIRAVGRLGFFTLICSTLMLGQLVTWLEGRGHRAWLVVLAVVVVAENVVDNRYLFSIASHEQRLAAVRGSLAQHAPCTAFIVEAPTDDFRAYAVQLDAMGASAETGIPTLNGWASTTPPGWSFRGRRLSGDEPLRWARGYQPGLDGLCVLPDLGRR